MAALLRQASVSWSGSAREGSGEFRVGSGALTAPYTYNSRFKGDGMTNPEELLLAAQAGCLTMALAAALQERRFEPQQIDTSAELELVAIPNGGYRIPTLRLELVVSGPESQDELDRALQRAIEMCPICNALAGTDIRVTVRPA